MLSIRIKYSMHDLICGVSNYCASSLNMDEEISVYDKIVA